MTRAKLSYGLLTSQNQGGGNKKQGLAPSIGKGQYIFRILSRKASHTEKEVEKEKEAVVLPVSTNQDGFLIKYSEGGDAQWFNTIKGTEDDSGYGIAVDSSNNIYLTGLYNSTTPIDLGNGQTLPETTYDDVFLIKYSAGGVAQWFKTIKGTEDNYGYGIAVDSSNNIYLTGFYNSTTTIDLGNGQTLPISTDNDGFLIKYSAGGVAQWFNTIKGTEDDAGCGITVDSLDNIYITGRYNSTTAIPLGNGKILPASTNNTVDGFLIKYSDVGDAQWFNTIKGTGSDSGYGIAVDSFDNIYLTGLYNSTTPIDLGNGKSLPETTNHDTFLIKYSAGGVAQWYKTIPGTEDDFGVGIAVDSLDNIYITGVYNSSTTIVL